MSEANEADFDLFSDFDTQEQQQEAARQEAIRKSNRARWQRLKEDPPERRTIAVNRWVYLYERHNVCSPTYLPCFLSFEECQSILTTVDREKETSWTTARHSTFTTVDIPITSVPALHYLIPLLQQRMIESILAPIYGFAPDQLTFRDLFIVRYDCQAQQGLAPHTDGCLMSFNILINSPKDFEGGGTLFYSASSENGKRNVAETDCEKNKKENTILLRPTQQGDAVHHDANIKHQGLDTTAGQRIILVGFVDSVDTIQKDDLAQQNQQRRRVSRN